MKEIKEFKVIECSGTPFEIGRQYGTAARDNIQKSRDGLIKGIAYMHQASEAEVLTTARKYLPLVEKFDPYLIEMLKGQAQGAGISFDEVFALRCGTELNFYYKRMTTLCTSFAATNKATKGGKTIIGQTYDFSPTTTLDLVKTRHADGLETLSLVVGAGVGGEVYLSSAGIGMALNIMVSPAREQLLNVPFSCVISKAMRQTRIGDALGIICSSGRSILHYAFASGEGDIIGVETRPDDYNVIYPEKDMLVHANHPITERFKRGEGTYGLMEGDSHIRYQRLKRSMEDQYGALDLEFFMGIFCDHSDYPRSLCKHVDDGVALGETIAAIVIDPAERAMYLTYGQPCQYEYVKYRL
jgi:isopenicillin-N N-acyltransferase like protein